MTAPDWYMAAGRRWPDRADRRSDAALSCSVNSLLFDVDHFEGRPSYISFGTAIFGVAFARNCILFDDHRDSISEDNVRFAFVLDFVVVIE